MVTTILILFFSSEMLRCVLSRSSKREAIERLQKGTGTGKLVGCYVPSGNVSDISPDDTSSEEDNEESNVADEQENEAGQACEIDQTLDVDLADILAENSIDNDGAKRYYRWRRRRNARFLVPCKLPTSDEVDCASPYEYFKEYFTDEIMDEIALHTNLYSVYKTGHSIQTNRYEMEQWLAIKFYQTVMNAVDNRMYWKPSVRWPVIADIMGINRYEKLNQFFHLSDPNKEKNLKTTDMIHCTKFGYCTTE